jgi:hypothetical protein
VHTPTAALRPLPVPRALLAPEPTRARARGAGGTRARGAALCRFLATWLARFEVVCPAPPPPSPPLRIALPLWHTRRPLRLCPQHFSSPLPTREGTRLRSQPPQAQTSPLRVPPPHRRGPLPPGARADAAVGARGDRREATSRDIPGWSRSGPAASREPRRKTGRNYARNSIDPSPPDPVARTRPGR